ncbi:PepSY-like domain-containing protein [Flavobacterium pedocola]
MKTKLILAVLALIISASSAFAQKIANDEVPAEVLKSFKLKFPSSTAKSWEMEGDAEYETDFDLKGKKHSATFDKSGKWLETETEIKISELPKAVSAAVTKDFAGFKIVEAEKAETSDHGTVYEVKVKKDKDVYDVRLSSDGKILKKETENNEEEND